MRDGLHDLHLRMEKQRAERRERRLMKTSTWDALTETLDDDERDPYQWTQVEFESTLGDTIAIERRRWIERAQWIVLALIMAGLGYLAGGWAAPLEGPKPWKCTVAVRGEGTEASLVDCRGSIE